MAFEFKKECKELYRPKNRPEIVDVLSANYIAVSGQGDPNEAEGAYQQAISVLYAVAYTLKMSYKTRREGREILHSAIIIVTTRHTIIHPII